MDWVRVLLALVVVLLPAVQTTLFLQTYFSATILDYIPATDDEVLLWHQTLTYNAVGFNGGYYTFEEYPAAFSLSHFAAHGPFFPMLYGTLASGIGWKAFTGAVLNLGFITFAVLFFILAVRPNRVQLILLGAVLSTFWFITYFIPDNSQESVHLAFGIILAAILTLVFRSKHDIPPVVAVTLVVLLLVMSLFRPFWSLLLIPLALMTTRSRSWKIRILFLAVALGLIFIIFLAVVRLSAPYPYLMRDLLAALPVSRRTALAILWRHLSYGIPAFFGFPDSYTLSVVERYEMLGIMAVLLTGLVMAFRKQKGPFLELLARHKTSLFILFSLGSIILVNILFYIPFGYQAYRVFAPFLLMAILMLLMEQKYTLVLLFIGINILCLPLFLPVFQQAKLRNFRFDSIRVQEFANATAGELQYHATQNPWCNTVLIDGDLFCMDGRCDYMLAIPPGIGLSMIFFPERLTAPLKSKYLLLSERGLNVVRKQIGENLQLSAVARTPYGTLFRNQAASCP